METNYIDFIWSSQKEYFSLKPLYDESKKLSNSLKKLDHKKISNLLMDQANILDGNNIANPSNYIENLTELFVNN